MKKKSQSNKNLDVMSAMADAAEAQFRAASMIAIGVAMRKAGISTLQIDPEDIEAMRDYGQMGITRAVNGGLVYTLVPKEQADAEVKDA